MVAPYGAGGFWGGGRRGTEENHDVTDNYPSLLTAVNGYHHNYDNRARGGNDSRVNYFKYLHEELEWFEYRQRISAEIASLHHREFVGNYKLASTYGRLMRFLPRVMPMISGSTAPLQQPPRDLRACFLIRLLFKMTPNWFNLFDPRLHAIRGVRCFLYFGNFCLRIRIGNTDASGEPYGIHPVLFWRLYETGRSVKPNSFISKVRF